MIPSLRDIFGSSGTPPSSAFSLLGRTMVNASLINRLQILCVAFLA